MGRGTSEGSHPEACPQSISRTQKNGAARRPVSTSGRRGPRRDWRPRKKLAIPKHGLCPAIVAQRRHDRLVRFAHCGVAPHIDWSQICARLSAFALLAWRNCGGPATESLFRWLDYKAGGKKTGVFRLFSRGVNFTVLRMLGSELPTVKI
jgi:hypothetical protein